LTSGKPSRQPHPETAAINAVIDRRNQQKLKQEKTDKQVVERLMEEKYVM